MLPTVVGQGNRMLPFIRRKAEPKPSGDWWTGAFTQEERATIEGVFASLGGGTAESFARSTNPNSLGTLAEYLKKEHLRHLGYKLLDRADTLVNENVPVLDLHFYFAVRGGFYYRWRDHDPLNTSLGLCLRCAARWPNDPINRADEFDVSFSWIAPSASVQSMVRRHLHST